MQLFPDSQDVLIKLPDFYRVLLTTELIPGLFLAYNIQEKAGLFPFHCLVSKLLTLV